MTLLLHTAQLSLITILQEPILGFSSQIACMCLYYFHAKFFPCPLVTKMWIYMGVPTLAIIGLRQPILFCLEFFMMKHAFM